MNQIQRVKQRQHKGQLGKSRRERGSSVSRRRERSLGERDGGGGWGELGELSGLVNC